MYMITYRHIATYVVCYVVCRMSFDDFVALAKDPNKYYDLWKLVGHPRKVSLTIAWL